MVTKAEEIKEEIQIEWVESPAPSTHKFEASQEEGLLDWALNLPDVMRNSQN